MSAGSFCAVTITVGTVMRTGAGCPGDQGTSVIAQDEQARDGTESCRSDPDRPARPTAAIGARDQFSVQSVSDETSLTKMRLPEMAGCVHVCVSATL